MVKNKLKSATLKLKKMVSILMTAGLIAAMPAMDIYASTISDNSVSDNELETESGSYANISGYNFSISEIRSGKTATFNGADGKYAILVFGGVGSCSYTSTVLGYLDSLLENMDMSQVNVYAIDIKNNTDDAIREGLALEGISDNIFAIYERKGTQCSNLQQICFQIKNYQGFTMPMVLFKDKSGNIYDYTEGMVGVSDLAEKMIAGGMQVNYDASMQKLNVTGQESYTYAYEVLNLVNAERAKAGVSSLTMDADLLTAAMNRAAECSVYFSHTRPNGLICFSSSSKMSGENIAAGQIDPQDVMNSWMNSTGHRENILNSAYKSIGIGCFQINGRWYWTQCFGTGSASVASKPANGQVSYGVMANASIFPKFSKTSTALKVGESDVLKICVGSTPIDPDSYSWESNSGCITVDETGKITAKSVGTATITATNKNATSKKLTHTITVSAAASNDNSSNNNPGNGTSSDKPGNSGNGDSSETTNNPGNGTSSDTPSNPGNGTSSDNPNNGNNSTDNNNSQNNVAMDQIRSFVERMYIVALGREAEEKGLQEWSYKLAEQKIDGAGIAQGFIGSVEFTNKNLSNDSYVNTLYKTFFDREPDAGGKANWISALNNGTSRNEVLAGFVNSLEFANLCDRYGIVRGTMENNGSSIYNAGVRNYVLRMYTKCLKRDGETLGVEDWSHRINTKIMSPEAVAKSFFSSVEFINKNLSNEDYVETLYETFMDRPSDAGGKADWVGKLNSGVSRQTVLEGFSRSPEFAKIMASFGL